MRTYDNYSLKNASLKFKILTTFWLAFSFALIAWSWFISLTVVNWYSSGLMKHWMLGPELLDLAWTKTKIFAFLFGLQTVAFVALWLTGRKLLRRSALRRRMKAVLSKGATACMVINILTWMTVPFSKTSQDWA